MFIKYLDMVHGEALEQAWHGAVVSSSGGVTWNSRTGAATCAPLGTRAPRRSASPRCIGVGPPRGHLAEQRQVVAVSVMVAGGEGVSTCGERDHELPRLPPGLSWRYSCPCSVQCVGPAKLDQFDPVQVRPNPLSIMLGLGPSPQPVGWHIPAWN